MTRRTLREVIFSILFKYEFNSMEEMDEQIKYTIEDLDEISDENLDYILDKTKNILALISDIDEIIVSISEGWNIDRIGKAELAILRLAIYEMKYDEDVPFKVAINEAVELAKIYCNDDAKRFINGLLAKVEE